MQMGEKTTWKALVVDDEESVREFVAAVLADQGWEVLEAKDGDEALQSALTHLPDLIVLDIMMPGKDGVEAFGELRTDPRTTHIPIIVLTSVNEYRLGAELTPESIAAQFGARLPEAFLQKPIETDDLLRVIKEVTTGM